MAQPYGWKDESRTRSGVFVCPSVNQQLRDLEDPADSLSLKVYYALLSDEHSVKSIVVKLLRVRSAHSKKAERTRSQQNPSAIPRKANLIGTTRRTQKPLTVCSTWRYISTARSTWNAFEFKALQDSKTTFEDPLNLLGCASASLLFSTQKIAPPLHIVWSQKRPTWPWLTKQQPFLLPTKTSNSESKNIHLCNPNSCWPCPLRRGKNLLFLMAKPSEILTNHSSPSQ